MSELLLELYSEEIPSFYQQHNNLIKIFIHELAKNSLIYSELKEFVGPCRIALSVTNIRHENNVVNIKGPRIDVDKAIVEKFCATYNIPMTKLQIAEINGNKYHFYKGTITTDIKKLLLSITENVIKNKNIWYSTMLLGKQNIPWCRPLKNILCIVDEEILPIKFDFLVANNITFGHKFIDHSQIIVNSFKNYHDLLLQKYVVISADDRKKLIIDNCIKISKIHNLQFSETEHQELINEIVGLVEYPQVVIGTISREFLDIPVEIIKTVMHKHQKYIVLYDSNNKLSNKFLFVTNILATENVILGNEKVLKARLLDAKYFYTLDTVVTLESRIPQLMNIVFHVKLGSVYDKVQRISQLAQIIDPTNEVLYQAAILSKADLTTGIVQEFPELQGTAGYYYALNDNLSYQVATAIKMQYMPQNADDKIPSADGGMLAMIDKLDSLVGLYLAEEVVTSSNDQYGLRRLALGIVKIIIYNKWYINIAAFIDHVIDLYSNVINGNSNDNNVKQSVLSFIEERLKITLKASFHHEIINACIKFYNTNGRVDIYAIYNKIQVLSHFVNTPQGMAFLQAYNRAYKILHKNTTITSNNTLDEIDIKLLNKYEYDLLLKYRNVKMQCQSDDYLMQLDGLLSLTQVINDFFDNVLLYTDEHVTTQNRVAIIQNILDLCHTVADFSHIRPV